ncbi:MAG: GGDEF domain-containing protein [Brevinematales bacterium]|nr:GGDEF domain-containing protein [Brevinematales bacterium]
MKRNKIKILFSSLLNDPQLDIRYRNRLFILFVSLAIPSFIIFGTIHIFDTNIKEMIINFSSVVILTTLFFLFFNAKLRSIILFLSTFFTSVAVSFLFYLGGENGSRIFWFYFIPIISFFLLKREIAFIFIIYSLIIIFLIFNKVQLFPFPPYSYDDTIKIRFFISYTLIVLFASIYSSINYQYNKTIKIENERLKKANEKIKQLSIIDNLTNCYNRNYFNTYIEHEIKKFIRYKTDLSLIMCDIDFFKKINDNFGHLVGDKVLNYFSNILLESVRKDIDYVFRIGGEEFIITLPHTNLSGAETLTKRIKETLEKKPFYNNGDKIFVSSSFGVIHILSFSNSIEVKEILKKLDECLYKAKKGGRNLIVSEIYK